METNRVAARQAMLSSISRLEHIVPDAEMNAPMTLNAVTPYMQTLQSTFGREVRSFAPCLRNYSLDAYQLWFAVLHCVHHWAQVCLPRV